ncbi:MAG: hypothetical protein HKN76_11325 [Saprospiraceae bacterium]|nr:hypothetical protein [Saprospiraceae bacterium]
MNIITSGTSEPGEISLHLQVNYHMITDDILLRIIAIFFGSMGLVHFVFGKTLKKYAIEADLLNANVAVKMSGAVLIISSIALLIPKYVERGFYGLCLFLVISSLVQHKFWAKNTALDQLTELLHFSKNLLIAILLWYLKDQFS